MLSHPASRSGSATSHSLRLLLASRCLCSASYYCVLPFALIVLPQHYAIPTTGAALLIGAAALFGRLAAWPVGRLVDMLGARRVLGVALAAVSLVSGLLALWPSAWLAMVQLVIASIAATVASVAYRVMIARAVAPLDRSLWFGSLASANNVGVVLGPLIATASLAWPLTGAQGGSVAVLAACALFTMAPVAPVAREGSETPPAEQPPAYPAPNPTQGIAWWGALANVTLMWALIHTLVVSLGAFSLAAFGALTAATVFFAVQGASVIPLLPLCGFMIRGRTSQARLVLFHAGALLIPAGFLALGQAPRSAGLVAGVLLAAAVTQSEALSSPSIDTLIADASPGHRIGRGFGVMATAQAFGTAIGAGLSSFVAQPETVAGSASARVTGIGGVALAVSLLFSLSAWPWARRA